MAHVSHKLSNSFEGALAGGGDPATSPLYVFGPFLKLIVVAGVAAVTFGSTIWLVVFTIATVSAMYRLVMIWVTDGSGGSGLSEEEFGGWAVKVNASITFIEYTLTFLVSMAAMVTFIADRLPILNATFLGIQFRTVVAIFLSILTGWLVNRGPKTAARAFGPATAGVLLLLWAMIITTIIKFGFHLPDLNLQAFSFEYIHFTFAGFTRMLAVMTGIEVFANLVAAYEGPPKERSNKAFGSLMIIMGTTALTMLIVGPAIYRLSDPLNPDVSVFTQTMDALLPDPLPYIGTLIGIAVLLSASAASAQGLQNLSLGLRERHYLPKFLGQRNKYNVADKPVWLEVGIVSFMFLVAGTNEETYLAIYAAGVFILLSMTGWAATKRLISQIREKFSSIQIITLIGIILAASITTVATIVIFEERFMEGAWTYFVFIPLLYAGFTYVRNKMGAPSPSKERIGELEGAMWGGFGFGQAIEAQSAIEHGSQVFAPSAEKVTAEVRPQEWSIQPADIRNILVPLDGSPLSEKALPIAKFVCNTFDGRITLLSSVSPDKISKDELEALESYQERKSYLNKLTHRLSDECPNISISVQAGDVTDLINNMVSESKIDLVTLSTRGESGIKTFVTGSVANQIIHNSKCPVLVVPAQMNNNQKRPSIVINNILVPLDGSKHSEKVLPYIINSKGFESKVTLLSVPEIPEPRMFGATVDEIQKLRKESESKAINYLNIIAEKLHYNNLDVQYVVVGTRPTDTILAVAEEVGADAIMMATKGLGGMDRILIGSVAEQIIQKSHIPVFLIPVHNQLSTPSQ
jgi:nucleotide-binding universal stress UspA family protein